MSQFVASGDTLYVGGGKLLFAHRIAQVECFGTVAVVRLDVPPGTRYNENIFGVSSEAHLLWQVKKEPRVYEDSPYTNLSRKGELAVASNWDGCTVVLEPQSGSVVEKSYGK